MAVVAFAGLIPQAPIPCLIAWDIKSCTQFRARLFDRDVAAQPGWCCLAQYPLVVNIRESDAFLLIKASTLVFIPVANKGDLICQLIGFAILCNSCFFVVGMKKPQYNMFIKEKLDVPELLHWRATGHSFLGVVWMRSMRRSLIKGFKIV
ncbi:MULTISPECIES: hypothetical protein [unclassified Synechococcus]|uniref:hypothetical protein n=1 Tax=unclassified Synechococcus TaxID=2626047 RepID=UPI0012E8E305|nr:MULTISPECIES: hypothetical protein [unclassified Synechococcus]